MVKLLLLAAISAMNAGQVPPGPEDRGQLVKATGRAIGTGEVATEEAKLDGLREAVRRVCGAFINSQSEVENFAMVRDKILEQPVGFARLVRVLRGPTVVAGEITEIEIEAEVFPVRFQRKWAEFAHIKEREGNPRCVIAILEDDDVGDANPPTLGGLVQAELENFFLGKDVRLMDKGTIDDVRKRDLDLAAQSNDIAKAAAIGASFKADVVVLGRAEAKQGNPVEIGGHTLTPWTVTLNVKAIQTDSGAILMSKVYLPQKGFSTTSGGGKDGIIALAKEAAPRVLSDIGDAWRKRTHVKTIDLVFDPCSRRRFRAIREAMIELKGVKGGEDGFRLRELVNDVATVEATWLYDLDQLADRIEDLKVREGDDLLKLSITEQTANRITVRVEAVPATQPASP